MDIVSIDAPFCCRFAVDTIYIKIIMMREWLQEVYLYYYVACWSTRQYNNNILPVAISSLLDIATAQLLIKLKFPVPPPHPQKSLPLSLLSIKDQYNYVCFNMDCNDALVCYLFSSRLWIWFPS